MISEFDEDSNIECKMCTNKFCNILQDKRSVITSKEEFMLPKEAEDFYEILNIDTKVINTEYKESYNKIMLKGDIEIKMIYLAESKDECIKRHTQIVPFSAMVELENINDRSKFDIEYLMQDFKIDLKPDITTSKTMSVDYKLEVNVVMFEEEEIEYVEDFYSQTKQLEYDERSVNVVTSLDTFMKSLDIKENVDNILDESTKLIDSKLDISNVNTEFSNMQVNIQGQAKIHLLTMNTLSMEVENKTVDIIINARNSTKIQNFMLIFHFFLNYILP